jgi:hypothetical protein
MIFYMPRQDGVSIVRVLHAARDWWGMLEVDSTRDNGGGLSRRTKQGIGAPVGHDP